MNKITGIKFINTHLHRFYLKASNKFNKHYFCQLYLYLAMLKPALTQHFDVNTDTDPLQIIEINNNYNRANWNYIFFFFFFTTQRNLTNKMINDYYYGHQNHRGHNRDFRYLTGYPVNG